ncbi:MAG TPA: response regulator [Polyangiaceae bacterium]|jgi:DNA-binding response OmpR family regulator
MRILIVDDEPAVLRCLERVLRKHYDVTTAERADAALILMSKRHFDAVLVDVDMPGMRGDELKAKLDASRAAHVVMMSGGCAAENADVLQKPLDLARLISALDAAAA